MNEKSVQYPCLKRGAGSAMEALDRAFANVCSLFTVTTDSTDTCLAVMRHENFNGRDPYLRRTKAIIGDQRWVSE